jgi:hypothetical protein
LSTICSWGKSSKRGGFFGSKQNLYFWVVNLYFGRNQASIALSGGVLLRAERVDRQHVLGALLGRLAA